MRDFTPAELETVKRMAATGATLAQTRRAIKIAPSNFAENIKALGLTFAPPLPPGPNLRREWTAAEIALIEREANAGSSAEQTRRQIGCGFEQLMRMAKERGITFKPGRNASTQLLVLTPEQDVQLRRLVEDGERRICIAKVFGVSISTIHRLCKDRGISVKEQMSKRATNVTQSRRVRSPGKAEAKWRNPMKDLGTWRPASDMTSLDAAVTRLRTRYCPVHAEETARKRFETPKAYGPETMFRVGSLRDVPAAVVLEMAGAV
jgi:hypothetical protein